MISGGSLSCRALLLGRLAALAASSAGVASTGEVAGAPGRALAAGADTAGANGGGQDAPDSQSSGLNASVPAATDAQCLLWQGDERGCGAVRDRDLCLRSVDGRPWRHWRGYLVYGQPCAWCDGESCLKGTSELCAPADWMRGRPRVTVASCSTTTPSGMRDAGASGHGGAGLGAPPPLPRAGAPEGDAASAPGFACGAEGAAVSSKVNNFYYTFTARSVDECKRLCTSKGYCRAVEYQAHVERCLLWWHPVDSVEPRLGHTCALVRGAELVEINSTEAEALTLAKLKSTKAEAEVSASSDPSTTADQEFFGELGSTSAEAESGIEVVLGDEPGTTADQDFWTSRRWALAGAALCATVAACAPLLWWAATRRAPRRATRAAELQRPSGLQDGQTDWNAYVSDDITSALVTAAAEPVAQEPLRAREAPLPVLLGPAAAPSQGFFKRAAAPTGAYALLTPRAEPVCAPPRWATVGGPLPPTPRLTPRRAPAVPPLAPRQAAATPLLTPRQLAPAVGPPAATDPSAPTSARTQPALPFRPEPVAVRRTIN